MENVNETNSNPVEQPATEPVIEPVAPLPFWAKLPRRNLIVIAALILITIILLTLSLFPETSVKQEANNPIPTPTLAPYVQSNLSLSAPQKNSNGKYFSNAEIATAQNQVIGVQVSLSYDPKVLTNVDITPGTFFANPTILLKKIDAVKGIINYTLFANHTQKSASGNGVIATLSFSVIPGKTSSTKINFLSTTEAVALGQFESVLKKTSGTSFTTK